MTAGACILHAVVYGRALVTDCVMLETSSDTLEAGFSCSNANMPKFHTYETVVTWTGNQGEGTSDLKTYSRSHEICGKNKPAIPGSSDPAFRGDPER